MTQNALTAWILGEAARLGIPGDIAIAQAYTESGLDPNAVSSAGAIGVFQLMPGTARDLGVSNPFDPVQNVTGGLTYLRQMYDRFGDWATALAAYNAGPGRVASGAPLPAETQGYVARILGAVGLGPSPPGQPDPTPGPATARSTGPAARTGRVLRSVLG